jgi:branched-chain amino acid transport system substrate-binding protein
MQKRLVMSTSKRSASVVLGVFVFLLIGVISSFAEEPQGNRVKIGVVIPLTGPLAASAQSFRAASLMALDDFGKGAKLRYELVFEDDQLQSKNAATGAKKLITRDKVAAIVSTWSYGGSVVAPIAERSQVIHIGIAWAPEIAAGAYNFLNLAPPSAFLPLILEVFKRRGFKRISTVVPMEAGSVYSAQELERLAPSAGLSVVSKLEVGYSETDFRASISKELSKRPDVIYVNLIGGQLDTFISQLRVLNSTAPVVIQTGLSTVSSLESYEGYWYAAETYFPELELEERLVRSVNHQHTLYAANFYDAIGILIQAFERSSDPGKGKPTNFDVLNRTNSLKTTKSIFPGASFNEDGVLSCSPRLFMIKGGVSVPSTIDEIVASPWGLK